MKDRQPLHVGRVHLAPVNGQQNTFDMTMADGATEQGTPLNKATFLKDATAALYGLTNAVPDDVFAWLGRYAEHCWRRRAVTPTDLKTDITSSVTVVSGSSSSTTRQIRYSNAVSVDNEGNISLVNPTDFTVAKTLAGAQSLVTLAPCYISNLASDSAGIYYLPEGASAGTAIGANTVAYFSNVVQCGYDAGVNPKLKKVSATTAFGEWEFVFSTNRSAYPDSGIQDGYEYEYIGVPFDNLTKDHVKIETGSYVGTNTYGASNPNSLTFGFVPKIVFIFAQNDMNYGYRIYAINGQIKASGYIGNSNYVNNFYWDDNIFSWYGSSAVVQLNENGQTYYYVAIG